MIKLIQAIVARVIDEIGVTISAIMPRKEVCSGVVDCYGVVNVLFRNEYVDPPSVEPIRADGVMCAVYSVTRYGLAAIVHSVDGKRISMHGTEVKFSVIER